MLCKINVHRDICNSNKNAFVIRTVSIRYSPWVCDVFLYFLLNLFKINEPIKMAADNANPIYEKFLS